MLYPARLCFVCLSLLIFTASKAQMTVNESGRKIIAAQTSFQKKSSFYQWLWGRNRRAEWGTKINVPIVRLDSIYGGLKPVAEGGGNETKSLHLKASNGRYYGIRSINKSRKDVILPIYEKTFVEDIIKDGVSSSHPYGAMGLAVMQEAAGIYHTLPNVVYVPGQAALDTFNNKYGNDLYLFEERPEGNWSEADNLGNFTNFWDTEDVIKKLQEDNRYKADQHAFIKARLFDMLIADWDRHEGNWNWGKKDSSFRTPFIPVPKDRDQAFYTHNGFLLDLILPAAGLSFMQNFDYKVKHINAFNEEERNLDRYFTNEMTLDDWIAAAKSLQQSLTDDVIEQSIKKLPPEIFAVSGKELIDKLKSRREQLVDFATEYYRFIAKEVQVVGTNKKEYFEVKKISEHETMVSVFATNNEGKKENTPYYQRRFKAGETKEIRLFGIDGEDVFKIDNSTHTTIRIIGGFDKDSVIQSGRRIHIYDDKNNVFETNSARLHLSSDSAIHQFKYDYFEYDSKGFSPVINYDYEDRVHVGVNYRFKKHKWRREPFASQHSIGINYSLSQNAVSVSYSALFPNLFRKYDLFLKANYDAVRWTNFYGFGNETKSAANNSDYYQLHSRDWFATAGLRRRFNKNTIAAAPFYRRVNIDADTNKYAAKIFQPSDTHVFNPNHYAGLEILYSYLSLNDSIVPTKGFTALAKGILANNFTQKKFFQHYSLRLQTYLPLSRKFSLAIRAGGATVVGSSAVLNSAQIFQHAVIGGPETLRGYPFDRFWGKTSFYNNNELRFITNLKTYVLNAKFGLLAFFDNGRVWIPDEDSNTLHTSYGGGVMLVPFNAINLTLTYGVSKESRLFQFWINAFF
jgi:hypothetical protein